MESYRLRQFFLGLIKIALRYPGVIGFPCSYLLEQMVMRNDSFIRRIEGDYTFDSHEFPLNGAGLKMYWRMDRDRRFSCRIGGDQAKDYSYFVSLANQLINEYKYSM